MYTYTQVPVSDSSSTENQYSLLVLPLLGLWEIHVKKYRLKMQYMHMCVHASAYVSTVYILAGSYYAIYPYRAFLTCFVLPYFWQLIIIQTSTSSSTKLVACSRENSKSPVKVTVVLSGARN